MDDDPMQDLTFSDSPSYTHAGEIFGTHLRNGIQLRHLVPDIMNIVSPSIPRMRSVVDRDWERSYNEIYNLYFAPNCTYPSHLFRRRFRMRRSLFERILRDIGMVEQFFTQRRDATGRLGLHPLQKMTVALRMLAYGCSADSLDERYAIGQTTVIQSLKMFCKTVIHLYSTQYLREPNNNDLRRLFEEGEERGFPGMLGSLDCMHWAWKNCPTAWHGQFRGHKGAPTLILEAVASKDLWIWHAFFGMTGANNDITVLDHSPLFNSFLHGQNTQHPFVINGNEYRLPYYLTDGIYPQWSTLVQSIPEPRTAKEKYFAERQEGARKDVERAFGVLQAKWLILQGTVRFWHVDDLRDIMMTCLILHNMIIEDERHSNLPPWRPPVSETRDLPSKNVHDPQVLGAFLFTRQWILRDRVLNRQLRNDLMDHLWNMKGLEDDN